MSSTSPKRSNTAVWIVTAGREKAGDSRFRGDIQVTQAHLKAFGFDSGPVDGIFTAQTQAAVRAFQARYGTQVSRLLDRDTREELDSGLNRKRTQSGGLRGSALAEITQRGIIEMAHRWNPTRRPGMLSYRRLGITQALLVLLVLGCTVQVHAPARGPVEVETAPAPHPVVLVARWQETAERLAAALTRGGYVVQAGQVRFFRVEDCLALPQCYGNNPNSPYGVYCLPPAPGEHVELAAKPPCPADGSLHWAWRLREDEALVFVGQTPPPARYFGFRNYVFSRKGWLGRRELFASLGDSLNLKVISTTGTPNGAAGYPFDRETVVISTADRNLDALLRQWLASSGAPEAIVNTDVIPRDLTRMGMTKESDEFTMLMRVAQFADATAGEKYIRTPPATVLRVTPQTPVPIEPFPLPPERPRGTETSEAWLKPALNLLIDAVQAQYRGLEIKRRRMRTPLLSGLMCLKRRTPCFGDNSDAVYSVSLPTRLNDDPRDFLVVVGVQHETTGKATFTSLAVYNTPRLMGIAAVTHNELLNSADRYLPTHPQRRYLYAYKFARHCQSEPYCSVVPTGLLGVPIDTRLNLIERAYLEPVTNTGPLPSQIVTPQVLHMCPAFTFFGRCDL